MAIEVKRSQRKVAVGSLWAALAAEEDTQGRRIWGLYWSKRKQKEEGGVGKKKRGGGAGRGGEGGRGNGGVEQREHWEDPLPTQPDRQNELSQTNRGAGGMCVGVVSRVQSKLSRTLYAHRGKKLLQDLQIYKVRQ